MQNSLSMSDFYGLDCKGPGRQPEEFVALFAKACQTDRTKMALIVDTNKLVFEYASDFVASLGEDKSKLTEQEHYHGMTKMENELSAFANMLDEEHFRFIFERGMARRLMSDENYTKALALAQRGLLLTK